MTQKGLNPRSILNFPTIRLPQLPWNWEDIEEGWGALTTTTASGLNVYQTKKNIVVEAAVPGLLRNEIEVTLDKSILLVRGKKETKEEDKEKQFFKQSSSSFTYSVDLPSQTDFTKDPKTTLQNGILTITFNKTQENEPKRIQIQG